MAGLPGDLKIDVRPVRQARLGIADLKVDIPSHVCLFYADDAELRERLGFLALALDDQDQVAMLFGAKERLAEVLGYIAQDGKREISSDLAAGRIVLVHGAPDIETIVTRITEALDDAVARGAKLIRFLGFIGWGDMDWPPEKDLMSFESSITETVNKYPAVVLCKTPPADDRWDDARQKSALLAVRRVPDIAIKAGDRRGTRAAVKELALAAIAAGRLTCTAAPT